MQEDLSKLSRKEIDDKMFEISMKTTAAQSAVVNAKTDSEKVATEGAYNALTAEYDMLKAELDKKASS